MKTIGLGKWCLVLVVFVFLLFAGGSVCAAPGENDDREDARIPSGRKHADVKLLIRGDIQLRIGDPDIYAPLLPAVQEFEKAHALSVSVIMEPEGAYREEVARLGKRKDEVNVVVADLEIGQDLISRGRVVPLDKWIRKDPDIIRGIPEGALQAFSRERRTYGIPVGTQQELLRHAYMLVRGNQSRGLSSSAMGLVAHLKKNIPLRDLPDLVVDTVSVQTIPMGTGPEETVYAVRNGGVATGETGTVIVHVDAVIANVGEAPAEGIDVTLSIGPDGKYRTTETVDFLRAGAKYELPVELEIPVPGGDVGIGDLEPLNIDVDFFGGVMEANELNNSLARGHWNEQWIDLELPDQPVPYYEHFAIDENAYLASCTGMGPKVAFDGTNFLVVWARQDVQNYSPYNAFNHTLRGKLVDENGITVDEFDITTIEGQYSDFNISFDGTNYLVVWERRFWWTDGLDPASVIEATAVTPAGVVLHDPPLVIEDRDLYGWPDKISHQSPDVVFDGQNYLVTYVSNIQRGHAESWEDPAGIYARQVTPFWGVSPPSVQIAEFGVLRSSWWAQQRTDVLGNRAVLAFRGLKIPENTTLASQHGIYGIWMNIDPVSGTPFALAPELLGSNIADVVVDGSGAYRPVVRASKNGKFVVVWDYNDWSNLTQYQYSTLYRTGGQALNAGWGYFQPTVPATSDLIYLNHNRFPAIAYSGDFYTIAYQHLEGCKTYLTAVHSDDAGLTSFPTVFYNAGSLVNRVDIAYGTNVGMIVYSDSHLPIVHGGLVNGIYAQFITLPQTKP